MECRHARLRILCPKGVRNRQPPGGLVQINDHNVSSSLTWRIICLIQNKEIMSNAVWLKNGRTFKQVENEIQVINNLPRRIYNMKFDPDRREIFLEDYADKFNFDFKIYGMESKLIEHIMKTFNNTTGNLGILFNGSKGTGNLN